MRFKFRVTRHKARPYSSTSTHARAPILSRRAAALWDPLPSVSLQLIITHHLPLCLDPSCQGGRMSPSHERFSFSGRMETPRKGWEVSSSADIDWKSNQAPTPPALRGTESELRPHSRQRQWEMIIHHPVLLTWPETQLLWDGRRSDGEAWKHPLLPFLRHLN